ncbi:hypothetical protein AB6D81_19010 [Vibrio splendidus]
MNYLVERKPHFFGFVIKNGCKVGSCVPFKHNDKVYILTCAHVLYGNNFEFNIKPQDVFKVDTAYGEFCIGQIISDEEFSKKYDLSLLEINVGDKLDSFLSVRLGKPSLNPMLVEGYSLITKHFDDEYLSDEQPVRIENQDTMQDFHYAIKFDKDLFHNKYIMTYGADAFKGISGSGLFYSDGSNIILSGLIKSLENSAVTSYGTFIDPTLISQFLIDIDVVDLKEFDNDRLLISNLIDDCIEKTAERAVANWINTNNEQACNVVRKLTVLYNKNDVSEEVNKVVSNLLNGDRQVQEWKERNVNIDKLYKKAKYSTKSNHLKHTVNSISEAQRVYRGLLNEHKDMLKDSFEDLGGIKVRIRESNIVANRDLSQWLAICDLDFTME